MISYYDPFHGQLLIDEPIRVQKADMAEADLKVAGKLNPQLAPKKKFKRIQGLNYQSIAGQNVSLSRKDNPYHAADGKFTDRGGAPVAISTGDWGMKDRKGARVQIDDPTSKHHGKTGEVIVQQGHSNSVTFDKGGMDWFNSGQLKELVPAKTFFRNAAAENEGPEFDMTPFLKKKFDEGGIGEVTVAGANLKGTPGKMGLARQKKRIGAI